MMSGINIGKYLPITAIQTENETKNVKIRERRNIAGVTKDRFMDKVSSSGVSV